ncbi:MAG: formylmethanofuran dehydrogenase subunit B [Planctomycetota bacterium]|nr:MAG: formylmethanofuran dehydrogenase subunit B [Planctomycetota bacterium]REJ92673.1 MAG: formylmethanofuran dehydrogenase subunit B [Planctomycetota bacterium]REK23709.1 MAG: formylmethanofuran dehydrogenase subunit B [Planctomycetota bacterium]REK47563.1 MAG: formylmethanofuran dehydrogenase subunit B [Planctomycetota bacterium]
MATASDNAGTELKIVEDATCTFCGCVCDDIELKVEGHTIKEAKRACVLGKAWFLNHDIEPGPSCRIDSQPATVEEGIERAARILTDAKYPIIYGLSDSPCEAQRKAVSIADWIGGTVDTTTSVCHGPSGMAFQGVGEVTCTLGEVLNRGDMIMFWGSNPAESHPRHFTKYSLMPKGLFTPNGRKDRTCVIVDVRKTKSAKAADIFIQIKPRKDFEALWTLRALARGIELDPELVESETGTPLAQWQELMDKMKASKFGVIFFGMGLTMTRGKHCNSEALLALTRDMNAHTRFVAKPNRGHGNVTGADNVVSWRTGYPFGVSLTRGYPRFNPGEYTTADTLSQREADAALIVASDPMANFPQPAREHLASIPYIALDPKETPTTKSAAVSFTVATYGINTTGTVYRMDDVPIPLRPAFESPHPSDYDVLSALEKRVKELKAQQFAAHN